MKRDVAAMTAKTYDIVIVGGGITGACVARDAALRGLTVALVDKGDFASATTAASSKLIHGGLRYLQNLELSLVRESLRERRIWSNVAPHLVDPLTFLLPTTRSGIKRRLVTAIGLTLYDWLAYDRNRLEDPEKIIPSHKKLNRKAVLEEEPGLESDDLTGALIFHDYQMYSPERLALACIRSAVAAGADVANYAQVTEFLREGNRVTGVRVRDVAPGPGSLPGEDATVRLQQEPEDAPSAETPEETAESAYAIHGGVVVNAAGPWADILMAAAQESAGDGKGASHQLIRSKGIHLVTRALTKKHAIAVLGDSSHFFILPWRGYSLLGTTDTVYEGDPDEVHATEKDIVNFLNLINKGYPGAKLLRSDVRFFYAGLRPIVDTTSGDAKPGAEDTAEGEGATSREQPDSYWASRASEVCDHEAEEGIKGLVTAIGGKWTTSRNLAEQVVDLAVTKLARSPLPCATEETPVYGGDVGPFAEHKKHVIQKHRELPPTVAENLARNYGSHVEDVLALAQEDPDWAARISAEFPDIAAEVVYAVREEMALNVEDVLFRRTGLGTLGRPGDAVIERVGDIMAQELGWDEAERTAQIDRAVAKFASWARTVAIVNPHSWGDRTGAIWPSIQAKLSRAIGPVESVFTDAPMGAQRLTERALKDGMEQVIAVGGDGTLNEVVNGFFEEGRPINPEAVLAFLTSGTGADFRRTFDIPPNRDEQIARLATSEIHPLDLGKLTFVNQAGNEETRFFCNIASFGLSGATDREVNTLTWAKKILGDKLTFQWGLLKALFSYKNQRVRIQVDDTFDEVLNVCVAAVCNGQYFGSGMHMAPSARPDDGLFDIVVLADIGRFELLRKVHRVYRGAHLRDSRATLITGRKVTALPVEGAGEVLLDVDGETPGRLPATFEILPNAINLRC